MITYLFLQRCSCVVILYSTSWLTIVPGVFVINTCLSWDHGVSLKMRDVSFILFFCVCHIVCSA